MDQERNYNLCPPGFREDHKYLFSITKIETTHHILMIGADSVEEALQRARDGDHDDELRDDDDVHIRFRDVQRAYLDDRGYAEWERVNVESEVLDRYRS